uniref:Uncharacterized protein n=1 Tax=Vitrella brassicaformis TaxID=1169539 RepID=A0A7S1PG75_9ALVE|mmetsp:Transcript_9215/g.22588  ORF Transcript_9215/g.22588 Transcript_9215/m.22588 type:complete len:118 (+) Transcript_9215:110-463(+)
MGGRERAPRKPGDWWNFRPEHAIPHGALSFGLVKEQLVPWIRHFVPSYPGKVLKRLRSQRFPSDVIAFFGPIDGADLSIRNGQLRHQAARHEQMTSLNRTTAVVPETVGYRREADQR